MSVVYSVDELERLLGTSVEAEDTAALREMEQDAVKTVEEITNRHLGTSTSLTEVRSGDGTRVLKLYNSASSITSVEFRYGDTWNTIDADEYTVYGDNDDDNELVLFGRTFPTGRRNIRVVYVAGSVPEAIPRDLRMTVARIALTRWRAERNGEPFEIPPDVVAALERWKVEDFMPQPRLVLGA